jgi:aspartate/methionine/tyrosine aminotransferase
MSIPLSAAEIFQQCFSERLHAKICLRLSQFFDHLLTIDSLKKRKMDTLSIRAQRIGANISPLLRNYMLVQQNQYDGETNPKGICNLGVAENQLCEQELVEKLQSVQTWKAHYNYYPSSMGELKLREELCHLFEDTFQLAQPLDPNRMLISSGLSGTMSLICQLIADPNDVLLIPSPYYSAFDFDVSATSLNEIVRCPLLDQETGKFGFSVDVFRHGYDAAIANNRRPRAIIMINPQNPLGDVYNEETVQSVLEFAAEKQLHVILDEIYAFSVFTNAKPFESMLNYKSLPDPMRTHFLWSFSKDFALSGVRLGVLYGGSQEMCTVGAKLNFLTVPSSAIQQTLGLLLADRTWTRSYLELNRNRLTEKYHEVTRRLEELDHRVSIRPSEAGFFIWINFRLILHRISFEEENRLFQAMFENGLYISSGATLGCSEPGWFRLIFSVKNDWIDQGLKRLQLALAVYCASPPFA